MMVRVTSCWRCDYQPVLRDAPVCPNCGCKNPGGPSQLPIIRIAIVIAAVVIVSVGLGLTLF